MSARASNLIAMKPDRESFALNCEAPEWVRALVADGGDIKAIDEGSISLAATEAREFSLVTACVRGVGAMPGEEVEQVTAQAYTAVAEQLSRRAAARPIRFWNHIPGIHQSCGQRADGAELDRYMAFNAGRYAACSAWFGGAHAFSQLLPTASGVGHERDDLVIHALAAKLPGAAVENPRQVPAYRYSERYGPKPPCFARATMIDHGDEKLLLVGGTASVRGEASVHIGDLSAQFDETMENLRALLMAADSTPDLASFRDVRIYYVRPHDLVSIQAAAAKNLPAARLEFVRADLCRRDLLVEVEGVTRLPATPRY